MTDNHDDAVDAIAYVLSIPNWGEYKDTAVEDHNKWTFNGARRTEFDRNLYREEARILINRLRKHLHDDTDEGRAYRAALGLKLHWHQYAHWDEHTPPIKQKRVTSQWRDA